MSWESPYFSMDEMRCQCGCGQDGMDAAFIEKLTSLRADWGQPMVITSAFRCKDHPIEAKKAKPGSHNHGRAVDVALSGGDAYNFLCAALGHGFTGIGVNQKGGSRFIHLDDLTSQEGWARPTVWSY